MMKRFAAFMGAVVFAAVVLAGIVFLTQQPVQQCAADAQFPDLLIKKIYLFKPSDDCFVAVKIKNRGPGRVPDFVWTNHNPKSVAVHLYVNGKRWGGATIWKFDSFRKLQPPGGTAEYVSTLKLSGPANVRAEIVLWNTLKENNPGNNSRTKSFKEDDCDSIQSIPNVIR